MEVWSFVFCVLTLYVLFPYLRVGFKRLLMAAKLKKICRKKGCTLHPAHRLWMFGRRNSKGNDFCIETESEVLSVKLFSVKRRRAKLFFSENGEYCFELPVFRLGYGPLNAPRVSKRYPLPRYCFRHADPSGIKKPVNILLVYPVGHDIVYIPDHGNPCILRAGDSIDNATLYTFSRLLGYLEVSSPCNPDC